MNCINAKCKTTVWVLSLEHIAVCNKSQFQKYISCSWIPQTFGLSSWLSSYQHPERHCMVSLRYTLPLPLNLILAIENGFEFLNSPLCSNNTTPCPPLFEANIVVVQDGVLVVVMAQCWPCHRHNRLRPMFALNRAQGFDCLSLATGWVSRSIVHVQNSTTELGCTTVWGDRVRPCWRRTELPSVTNKMKLALNSWRRVKDLNISEEEPVPEPGRDERSGCAKGNLSYSCMGWDTAELRENGRGAGYVWKQNGYGKVGWVYVCVCVYGYALAEMEMFWMCLEVGSLQNLCEQEREGKLCVCVRAWARLR